MTIRGRFLRSLVAGGVALTLCGPLGAAGAAPVAAAATNPTNTPRASPDQVQEWLRRVADQQDLSAVVLVVQDGRVLAREGYGIADDATGTPFTPATVVGLASVSKQFTAAAFMRLVDEGLVDVDTPLSQLLPDVPADKQSVTPHQLLTHTSGLPSDFFSSDLEPLDRATALARILALDLGSEPGARYSYSNAGYTLLAAIIERLTGRSHRQVLRDDLLAPLGLEHTGYWDEPFVDVSPQATGYINGQASGPLGDLPGPFWTVIGNGELVSTVDDVRDWYEALSSGRVLSPESTRAVFTAATTPEGRSVEYGYGWEVSDDATVGHVVTHNGGGLTGNTIVYATPDLDLLTIVLGNRITFHTVGRDLYWLVDLPADQTAHQLARNVATRDFTALPPAETWDARPWTALAAVVLAVAVAATALLVRTAVRARHRP